MHGIIFNELKKFVTHSFGNDAWAALLAKTGQKHKVYLATEAYPDEELVAAVGAAVDMTSTSAPHVLESFGRFIVPDLADLYRPLLDPAWGALDLIQEADSIIHTAVRLRNRGAQPPRLRTHRDSATQLTVTYDSPRRLCHVARGIIRGVGEMFGQKLEITEARCMLRGAGCCEIVVRARPN